jgi:hypothetical protein
VSAGAEDLRAEVAELRIRLDRALKVIGLVYDAGWEDALGTPGTNAAAARTAYRLGMEAGQRRGCGELPAAGPPPRRRSRHLRAVQ